MLLLISLLISCYQPQKDQLFDHYIDKQISKPVPAWALPFEFPQNMMNTTEYLKLVKESNAIFPDFDTFFFLNGYVIRTHNLKVTTLNTF